MKKTILGILCFALVAIVLILGTSVPVSVKADTPRFAKEKVSVYLGKTKTLNLENATNEIIWRSGNEDIVTVNGDGKLTPVSEGKAMVYATYKHVDYPCEVTVKKPYLSSTEIEVFPFETFSLSITGTTVKKWDISDKSVISYQSDYDSTYTLKALAVGEANFTIKGKDKKEYVCHITVKHCSFKETYYDKSETRLKSRSYYVDGRLQKYISYSNTTSTLYSAPINYSLTYVYENDYYTEYKNAPNIVSKTVYDYDDNVIGETTYFNGANIENPDARKRSEWFTAEDGFVHKITYRLINQDGTKVSVASRVCTFFPDDGGLASDIEYNPDGLVTDGKYYNQNPYFKNKEVRRNKDYYSESYYDFSGRRVRIITYDENNNIISDHLY